jgi:hypothetical protein
MHYAKLETIIAKRVPYDVPCPPEVGRIEACLPCVYPFAELVVSEAGNPNIQQALGCCNMREAAVDEHCIVKTQEDHEVEGLEDLQISGYPKAADCKF